ncbi:MAG: hypothetical protein R3C02_12490 [Planctomycetaceae bacterium]
MRVLLCGLCFLLPVSVCLAEEQRDSRLAVLPDGRVDEILNSWRKAYATVETARIALRIYESDYVFLQEKRGKAEFLYQYPDRLSLEFQPVRLEQETEPARKSGHGDEFELRPLEQWLLYVDRHEVIIADPVAKTFDLLSHPPSMRDIAPAPIDPLMVVSPEMARVFNPGWFHKTFSPYCIGLGIYESLTLRSAFLSGSELDQYQRQFNWTIERDDAERIQLSGKSGNEAMARNLQRVDVILDPETFRTKSVRFIDPSGSKATVYVVSQMTINEPGLFIRKPNLSGYKLTQEATRDVQQTKGEGDSSAAPLSIICGAVLLLLFAQAL